MDAAGSRARRVGAVEQEAKLRRLQVFQAAILYRINNRAAEFRPKV
jgi:hypothetical protein